MTAEVSFKRTNAVIFTILIVTGMTGLIYQVAWQKYLTYLIGSESRSSALVIGMFLAGLAAGNAFFGSYAQRHTERKKIINTYALCEAAIGIYALVFPSLFDLISPLVWAMAPKSGVLSFLLHLCLTFLLIFPPTFFMGSTITLLTKVMPRNLDESGDYHAKIYGINTIGAFVGVTLSAMLIFPLLGLSLGLTIFGLVNLISALILASLPISGKTIDTALTPDKQKVQSLLSNRELMAISFFSGLIVIAIELLTIRLFSLAAGPTHLAYPLVVGLFILALARGSLGLPRASLDVLRKTLWSASIAITFFFATIPFWPYWFSNIRASLTEVASNYYVYYCTIFLLLLLVVSPAIYFLGRLLPLSYALMEKKSQNYARLVGVLYVVNTLGTLIGALVPGHYLLALFDIPTIFLFFGLLLLIYAVRIEVLLTRQNLRWALLSTGVLVVLSLNWNRTSHYLSPYNSSQIAPHNFKGLFHIANMLDTSRPIFFKDGPNTTVTVLESENARARSIIVNGKSDGSTEEPDLSTVTLLTVLPYLNLAVEKNELVTSVIGLGTGITPGILASLDRVSKVETLEIAPMVIKAARHFDKFNYNLSQNPKASIINQDAFSFYGPRQKEFDLIISEPSNPWLSGVENLFSSTFYQLVSKSLRDGGIFTQWIHTYHMNEEILASIFENLLPHFKHIALYQTSRGDVAILCGNHEFNLSKQASLDPKIKKVLKEIGVEHPQSLDILKLMDQKTLYYVTLNNSTFQHDLHHPLLQHFSSRSFFMRQRLGQLHTLLNPYHARFLNNTHLERQEALKAVINEPQICPKSELKDEHFYCEELNRIRGWYQEYRITRNIGTKLRLYSVLRKENAIALDKDFLTMALAKLPTKPTEARNLLSLLVNEWLKEDMADEARNVTQQAQKLYPEAAHSQWVQKNMRFIEVKELQNKKLQEILAKKI